MATGNGNPVRRVTVPWLRASRDDDRRISMVTAYDTPSARLADAAGVDSILVGDSIGTNVLGLARELPVTMDDMVRATQAVARGTKRALVVTDLPFGSYQASVEDGMRSAIRLVKEGGAQAVKLEGGLPVVPLVQRLTEAGIPVVGHLGFTPQSTHALGGARVQGKRREEAQFILDSARGLQAAGAFAIVLELIPIQLAQTVTGSVSIPTIGIGSGPYCDGQVQVWHDLLGLGGERVYRHVRRYAHLGPVIQEAISSYVLDVQSGQFPTVEHGVGMDVDELSDLDSDSGFSEFRHGLDSEPVAEASAEERE